MTAATSFQSTGPHRAREPLRRPQLPPARRRLRRGEGVWLTDVDGKRYMDFLAAYSAVNQGHNHPRIAEAMIAQARHARPHRAAPSATTSSRRSSRSSAGSPASTRRCLMNSGAEAVETAIKAMRKWGYDVKGIPYRKAEIIVAEGNFHGRTTTIVGFSTDPDSTSRFGPFTPGFRIVAVRRPRRRRGRDHARRPAPSSSSRSRARAASSSRRTATCGACASWPTGTTAS